MQPKVGKTFGFTFPTETHGNVAIVVNYVQNILRCLTGPIYLKDK